MDSAHNKVQVYIRVRPYAYDYEVDMEKNKEIKEGELGKIEFTAE